MQPNAIAVVGLGTMGSGIAIVGLQAGFDIRVLESDATKLASGVQRIDQYLEGSVKRGKISSELKESMLSRLHPTTEPNDLADCQYLIEAVFEDVETKRNLFLHMNSILDPRAVFLTNTSTLSVTAIGHMTGRETRVVGMHFGNPAPLMKLVEITKGLQTSEGALEETVELARRLGKAWVVTQDTPGFILNYFLVPFENDCIRALESGLASVEDIDKAIKLALGYPMGTFELLDTVGLDIHYEVSMRLFEQLHDERFAPPPLVKRMIAANLLGRKTGHGFYHYGEAGVFGG